MEISDFFISFDWLQCNTLHLVLDHNLCTCTMRIHVQAFLKWWMFRNTYKALLITAGAYISWWPYTIYKSKNLELFLLCSFVYWIRRNKLIFKMISLLYSFVYLIVPHFCQRMRAYKAAQIPRSETQDIQFFKIQTKIVLLWKMSSRLSKLHHIRFLYLT
jgi:hypothetical protein